MHTLFSRMLDCFLGEQFWQTNIYNICLMYYKSFLTFEDAKKTLSLSMFYGN